MTKPITNQRTKQEIRDEVAKIDKEVPDTEEFVKIMKKEEAIAKGEELPEETPEDTIEIEDTSNIEETEEVVETSPQDEEEVEVEKQTPVKKVVKKDEDFEQRWKEAGQEAMILNSKNKKFMDTVEEVDTIPEPTEAEVRAYAKELGEDYDNLQPFAQNLLKRNLVNEKAVNKIKAVAAEEKELSVWRKRVENFVELEDTANAYPSLADEDREEFIKYATKKTHVGSDFDLLVAGFFYRKPAKPAKKATVLLPSSRGGSDMNPKPVAKVDLNEDDAKHYRTTDQKKFKEMIKKKKFKITV